MTKPFFWVPFSLILALTWLLLSDEISVLTIVTALVLGAVLTILSLRLRPDIAYPRKILSMISLLFTVIKDVFVSNFSLMKQILFYTKKQPATGFVNVTLRIEDPHALAFLACIISFTPGTLWCGLMENNKVLRLHLINLDDKKEVINHIRYRYEQKLLEIFE